MFSSLEPMVVSSKDNVTESLFSGYAFVGPDIVIGADGHKEWMKEYGATLRPHEDGTYFVVNKTADGLDIGSDYKGYSKVFYYRNGSQWAVSNSFAALVEFLKSEGWKLTFLPRLANSFVPMPTFWQQLATFSTAVQEIRLLPRQSIIKIDSNNKLTLKYEPLGTIDSSAEAYEERLATFVSCWLGRLSSVFSWEGGQLETELSGGMDSRTTFSLLLGLKQRTNNVVAAHTRIRSAKHAVVDFECASHIATTYGFDINSALADNGHPLQPIDPFTRWKYFSLGVYAPVIWSPKSYRHGQVKMGGHGGEAHRGFYAFDSLERACLKSGSPRDMKSRMEVAGKVLAKHYPGEEPLVAHYKEFRDRLHSALHAQNHVRMQPLSSKYLDAVTAGESPERLKNRQVLYDIMSVNAPGLMLEPYDSPKKTPSEQNLSELVKHVVVETKPGRVFGTSKVTISQPTNTLAPWTQFCRDLRESEKKLDHRAFTADQRSEIRAKLSALEAGKKLGHPRESVILHNAMLFAEILS